MTTVPIYSIPSYKPVAASRTRIWSMDFWRALICCALFSVIVVPEFSRDGLGSSCSFLYLKVVAGFRFVDLAIFLLVFCHVVALGCSRIKTIHFPRALLLPGFAFLGCVGHRHGLRRVTWWKQLLLRLARLGPGHRLVFHLVVLDAEAGATSTLSCGCLLFTWPPAWRFCTCCSSPAIATRWPAFPFPSSTGLLCRALSLADCWPLVTRNPRITACTRLLWGGLATAAYAMVLLCFRRTYWGELASRHPHPASAAETSSPAQRRLSSESALCVTAGVLGSSFASRIQSFDVTSADNEFNADNSDHLLDLADAWDQVRQSPVMGIGLGTSYPTWRIKNWKTESVMVHNAPLHVWLKYGLAGLVCYLWFHLALLRWLYRRSRSQRSAGAFSSVAFRLSCSAICHDAHIRSVALF